MEFLQVFLPTVLYCLGIILVIVLIVLAIKAIETLTKVNTLLDDAQDKMNRLNGFFQMMDAISDKAAIITDTVVSSITSVITRIFKKRKRRNL